MILAHVGSRGKLREGAEREEVLALHRQGKHGDNNNLSIISEGPPKQT